MKSRKIKAVFCSFIKCPKHNCPHITPVKRRYMTDKISCTEFKKEEK